MITLSKEEAQIKSEGIMEKIDSGRVFIHPTDTIYGLGCDARNKEAVQKIRDLKKRSPTSAMSIIAPSKDWILENCEVDKKAEEWVNKLPGPYTLILKLKNKNVIADNVAPEMDSIGVRIPEHWISNFVEGLQYPIITTSANVSGKSFMTSIDNLDLDIEKGVSFVIYEGEKKGRPSKLVHLDKEEIEEVER